MVRRAFILHALSPLHAGTGHSADVIDLPIARMKATGIPFVPGSSIKGVLRHAALSTDERDSDKVFAVFGPDTDRAAEHAGALVVSDARLLALPVRSFRGTFAWVTSPLLLSLAARDTESIKPLSKAMDGPSAVVTANSKCSYQGKIYLEDLDLNAENHPEIDAIAKELARLAWGGKPDVLTSRLVVTDDETMSFLWETATQLDTRIRLDPATGTVAKGALWVEESLPPESLLIGILDADKSRGRMQMSSHEVCDYALPYVRALQFGGKATVGRGLCRMIPIPENQV